MFYIAWSTSVFALVNLVCECHEIVLHFGTLVLRMPVSVDVNLS